MSQGYTRGIYATPEFGLSPVSPTLPSAVPVGVYAYGLGFGDNPLYTVPQNRRALIINLQVFNGGGVGVRVTPYVTISGTTYLIAAASSTIAANANQVVAANGYVAEAGEIIGARITSSASLINIWGRVIEFDANAQLKSPRLTSLTGGNDTLYTVPTGRSAKPMYTNYDMTNSPKVVAYNGSGASRTYNLYAVPNGGSPDSTNKTTNNQVIADGGVSAYFCAFTLVSGDSLVIASDSANATQFCYTTVMEI